MEALLTYAINSCLRKFIKSAAGRTGSNLRVALSAGSVILKHLELNLRPVLKNLPVIVQRAFVQQLSITLPWTSLSLAQIQVRLDTVEIVLALQEEGDDIDDDNDSETTAGGTVDGDADSSSSWLGSWQSYLHSLLCNLTVQVNNMVVKLKSHKSVATLTLQNVTIANAKDSWIDAMKEPEKWIKKLVEVNQLTLSLEELGADGAVVHFPEPLLKTPKLQATIIAPALCMLAGEVPEHDEYCVRFSLDVHPIKGSVNNLQIGWLNSFLKELSETMTEVPPVDTGQEPVAVEAEPEPPDPSVGPPPLQQQASSSWFSALTQEWETWLTDPQDTSPKLTSSFLAPAARDLPLPTLHATATLQGADITLATAHPHVTHHQRSSSTTLAIPQLPPMSLDPSGLSSLRPPAPPSTPFTWSSPRTSHSCTQTRESSPAPPLSRRNSRSFTNLPTTSSSPSVAIPPLPTDTLQYTRPHHAQPASIHMPPPSTTAFNPSLLLDSQGSTPAEPSNDHLIPSQPPSTSAQESSWLSGSSPIRPSTPGRLSGKYSIPPTTPAAHSTLSHAPPVSARGRQSSTGSEVVPLLWLPSAVDNSFSVQFQGTNASADVQVLRACSVAGTVSRTVSMGSVSDCDAPDYATPHHVRKHSSEDLEMSLALGTSLEMSVHVPDEPNARKTRRAYKLCTLLQLKWQMLQVSTRIDDGPTLSSFSLQLTHMCLLRAVVDHLPHPDTNPTTTDTSRLSNNIIRPGTADTKPTPASCAIPSPFNPEASGLPHQPFPNDSASSSLLSDASHIPPRAPTPNGPRVSSSEGPHPPPNVRTNTTGSRAPSLDCVFSVGIMHCHAADEVAPGLDMQLRWDGMANEPGNAGGWMGSARVTEAAEHQHPVLTCTVSCLHCLYPIGFVELLNRFRSSCNPAPSHQDDEPHNESRKSDDLKHQQRGFTDERPLTDTCQQNNDQHMSSPASDDAAQDIVRSRNHDGDGETGAEESRSSKWSLQSLLKGREISWELTADSVTLGGLSCCGADAEAILLSFDHIKAASKGAPGQQMSTLLQQLHTYRGAVPYHAAWHADMAGFSFQMATTWVPTAAWKGVRLQEGLCAISNSMTAALLATRDTNPSSDSKHALKVSFTTSPLDMRFTAVHFSALVAWLIDIIVEALAKFGLPLLQRTFTASQLKDLCTVPWLNAVLLNAASGFQLHVPPNNTHEPAAPALTRAATPVRSPGDAQESVVSDGRPNYASEPSQLEPSSHKAHPSNILTAAEHAAGVPNHSNTGAGSAGDDSDAQSADTSTVITQAQKAAAMLCAGGVSLVLAAHACSTSDPQECAAGVSVAGHQQYLPGMFFTADDIEVDLYPLVMVRTLCLELHAAQVLLPPGCDVVYEWTGSPDESTASLLPHLAKYGPPTDTASQPTTPPLVSCRATQDNLTGVAAYNVSNVAPSSNHPLGGSPEMMGLGMMSGESATVGSGVMLDVWRLSVHDLGVFGTLSNFSFLRSTETYPGMPVPADGASKLPQNLPLPAGDINTYAKKYIIAASNAVLHLQPKTVGILMQFSKSMSTGPMFAIIPYIPCTSTAMFDTSRYSIDCPDLLISVSPSDAPIHDATNTHNVPLSAPKHCGNNPHHSCVGSSNKAEVVANLDSQHGSVTVANRKFFMVYKTTNLWQLVSYPESAEIAAYESAGLSTLWNFSTEGMKIWADVRRSSAAVSSHEIASETMLVATLDKQLPQLAPSKTAKLQAVIQYGGLLSTFYESRCSLGHVKLWAVPDLLPLLKAMSQLTDNVLPPLVVPGAVARRTRSPPPDRSSTSLTAATLRLTASTTQAANGVTPDVDGLNVSGPCNTRRGCGHDMDYSVIVACTDLAYISHDSPVAGKSEDASVGKKPRRSVVVAAGVSVLTQLSTGGRTLQATTVLLPTHAQLVTYTTPSALCTHNTPSKTTTLRLPSLHLQLSLPALHSAMHVFQGFKASSHQGSPESKAAEEKLPVSPHAASAEDADGSVQPGGDSNSNSNRAESPVEQSSCIGIQVDSWRVAVMRDAVKGGDAGVLGHGRREGLCSGYFTSVDELLVFTGGQLLGGVQDWGGGVRSGRLVITSFHLTALERASVAHYTLFQLQNMVVDVTSASGDQLGVGTTNDQDQASGEEEDGIVLGASGSLEDLLATLQPPTVSGLQVNIQLPDNPLRLHLHDLGAEALVQAVAYGRKAAAVASAIITGQLPSHLERDILGNSASSSVGVHNTCPWPFFIRQQGSNRIVVVPGGKTISLFWSEALGGDQQVSRKVQVAQWREGVGRADQLQWSEAVEVPILSAHQLTVPWSHSLSARIALTVSRVPAFRYLVTIRTGLLIANRSTQPITLCLNGSTPDMLNSQLTSNINPSNRTHAASSAAPAMPSPKPSTCIMHLGCSVDAAGPPAKIHLLPLDSGGTTALGARIVNSIQVLMEESTWSKPFTLSTTDAKAGRIEAALGGPTPPPINLNTGGAQGVGKEMLHFSLGLPDPATGQSILEFWPHYRLHNLLPLPVSYGLQQLPGEASTAVRADGNEPAQVGRLHPGARASLSQSSSTVSLLHLQVRSPRTDWHDFYAASHHAPDTTTSSPFSQQPQTTTTSQPSNPHAHPSAPHPHGTPTRLSSNPTTGPSPPVLFAPNNHHADTSSSDFTNVSAIATSPSTADTSQQRASDACEVGCNLPNSPLSLTATPDYKSHEGGANCVPTLASLQRTSSNAAAMLTSHQCSPAFSMSHSLPVTTPPGPQNATSSSSACGPWQLHDSTSGVSTALQLPRMPPPGTKLGMVLEHRLGTHTYRASPTSEDFQSGSCGLGHGGHSTSPSKLRQGHSHSQGDQLDAQDPSDAQAVSVSDVADKEELQCAAGQLEVSAIVVPEVGGSGAAEVLLLPNGLLVNGTAMPVELEVVDPGTHTPSCTQAASSSPLNMPSYNPNTTYKAVIKALLPLPPVSTANPNPAPNARPVNHWLELSSSSIILAPGATKLVALLSTHRTNSPAPTGLWAGAACVAVSVDIITWTQPPHSAPSLNPRKQPPAPPHQILRVTVSPPLTVVNLSPSSVQLNLQGVMDNSHSGAFCSSEPVACTPGGTTPVPLADVQLLRQYDPRALTHKTGPIPPADAGDGVSLRLQMSHSSPLSCTASTSCNTSQNSSIGSGSSRAEVSFRPSNTPHPTPASDSARISSPIRSTGTYLPCQCAPARLSIPGCARGRLCTRYHSNPVTQDTHSRTSQHSASVQDGKDHVCDSSVMYRLAIVDGRHTLLLWNDSQPCVLLHNTLSVELEVGYCKAGPPHTAHTAMQRVDKGVRMCKVFLLGPCAQLPLFADDLFESPRDPDLTALEGEDTDEGSLLVERMAGQAPSSGFDPCILCVRLKGSTEWFPPFECEPGLHGLGSLASRVVLVGPTTHVTFTPRVSGARFSPDLSSSPLALQPLLPSSTRLQFFCRSIQVSLWDKEVRHGSTSSDQLQAPKELLCLTLDTITASLQTEHKTLPAFTTFPPTTFLKSTTLALVVQDIQCDTYLTSVNGTVVATTRHESRRVLPSKNWQPANGTPPMSDGLLVQIDWVQVLAGRVQDGGAPCNTSYNTSDKLRLERGSTAEPACSQNKANQTSQSSPTQALCQWVESVHVQVPVLVVVLDDPLLLFGTRTLQSYLTLLKGMAPADDVGGQQTAHDNTLYNSSAAAAATLAADDESHSGTIVTSGWHSLPGNVPGGSCTEVHGTGVIIQSERASNSQEAARVWVEIYNPEDVLTVNKQRLVTAAGTLCGSPVFVRKAACSDIRLLLDLHLAEGGGVLPISLDTNRSPFTLNRVRLEHIRVPWPVMKQALSAHYMAEGLMNVPQVLGSFELLFNLTGLVGSVTQGVWDLVALPLAGLEERSAAAFLAALCRGSASLPYYLSRWTLTSISGFSSAFAKLLRTSITQRRSQLPLPPTSVSSAYRPRDAPLSISSIASSVGRGMLGMIGYPLSGALDVVSAVSGGLATSTGITAILRPQRPALPEGTIPASPSAGHELSMLAAIPEHGVCLHRLQADITITSLLHRADGGPLDGVSDNAGTPHLTPGTALPFPPPPSSTWGTSSKDLSVSQGHVASGNTVLITTCGVVVTRPGGAVPWLVMPLDGLQSRIVSGKPSINFSHEKAWLQTRVGDAADENWVWVSPDHSNSTGVYGIDTRSSVFRTDRVFGASGERTASQDDCESGEMKGCGSGTGCSVQHDAGREAWSRCVRCGATCATGSATAAPTSVLSGGSGVDVSAVTGRCNTGEVGGMWRPSDTAGDSLGTERVKSGSDGATGLVSWLSRGVGYVTAAESSVVADSLTQSKVQGESMRRLQASRGAEEFVGSNNRDAGILSVAGYECSVENKGGEGRVASCRTQMFCSACAGRGGRIPSGYACVGIVVDVLASEADLDVSSVLDVCSILR